MGIDMMKYTDPLFNLYNSTSGIVNFITEVENELNHPEVFVVAATSCDLQRYGIPLKYKINGSGAGLSWENAYCSALGETIERYALSVIYKEDLYLATSEQLKEDRIKHIPPQDWSLFDQEQDITPYSRFEAGTPVAWAKVAHLIHKEEYLVPASLVYLPYYYHFKEQGENIICASISTGAACAKTKHEAILKGIAELIERDAFMIMWKNRIPCEKICIDKDSAIYSIYESRFKRPGLSFDLYYTKFDFEMHSVFGVLADSKGAFISRVVGGAAHPDPETAVLKTLIELVQGLVWKDYKGDVQFPVVEGFENVGSFENRMELYAYNDMSPAFEFLPEEATLLLSELKCAYGFGTITIKESLDKLLAELQSKEYDVLGMEVECEESRMCNVHVVKMIIPQLEVMDGEHKHQFLGGKRWKQIPAMFGFKQTGADHQINPFPHPYP